MSVKIRMARIGRRHRPFFRINAIESREPRNGRILEKLGHYDPIEKDKDKQIVLNTERVQYWLDKGAVPSDSVSEMLLRLGIKHKYAEQKLARRQKAKAIAHAQGKPFDKTERIALEKAAQAAKEAEEKSKAEAEKKEETKTEAKVETKEEVKVETKVEAKEEIKVETKVETKEEVKAETKVETKEEAKAETKVETKEEAKAEPEKVTEVTEEKPAEPEAKEEKPVEPEEEKKADGEAEKQE